MARGGIVLVTGVGQGFGRSVALGWGRSGYDVVCADRDVGLAARTAAEVEEVGGQAIPIQTDITAAMDVRDAFAKVGELFGELEGVVHVASRSSSTHPSRLTDSEFHELTHETLLSSHLVLRTAARVFDEGWVVIVGPPTSASAPQNRMVRAGLEGLMAGYDAASSSLRANLILPSRPAAGPRHDARLVEAALFLGGDSAAGVRGATLRVDLPPPPRASERLLPEIQAALDDRIRQGDLDDDGFDDLEAGFLDDDETDDETDLDGDVDGDGDVDADFDADTDADLRVEEEIRDTLDELDALDAYDEDRRRGGAW